MEYLTKSLGFFWKGESSALAILLKAEGEPLPRKRHLIFLAGRRGLMVLHLAGDLRVRSLNPSRVD